MSVCIKKEQYLDDSLTATEAAVFKAHLADCAECAAAVSTYHKITATCASIVVAAPHLQADIMAALPDNYYPRFSFWSQLLASPKTTMVYALTTLMLATFGQFVRTGSNIFTQHLASKDNATEASAIEVSFQLDPTLVTVPQVYTVAVVGDFNNWSSSENLLSQKDDKLWSLKMPVSRGIHEYMFVINDNIWITDPAAKQTKDDGFGSKNSILDL